VQKAREQIAADRGNEKENRLHSGPPSSDNLAIKGVAEFYREKGNHIVTTRTEHKAVLDTCKRLERQGFEVTYLEVDKHGRVSPEQWAAHHGTKHASFVSIMFRRKRGSGPCSPSLEIGAVVKGEGHPLPQRRGAGIGAPFDAGAR